MISELFHIGPLSVSPFGVLLVAAFLTAFLQLRWGMKRLGVGNEDDANAILIAAAIGGLLGGKLYYALLYGDWHLVFSRAGIVFYGSLIGGALAVIWTLRRRRVPFAPAVDATAPSLALGYAVGRIGCLLVGDDYGIPTNLPWGLTFPVGPIPTTAAALARNYDVELPAGASGQDLVAVHPTQIYETLAALVILLIGRRMILRRSAAAGSLASRSGAGLRSGSVALVVIGLLAVERFLVEFLRAKDDRFFGSLTLAQMISLAILLLVIVLATRARPSPAESSA